MSSDIGSEIRRPLPLSLLILAILGWVTAVSLFWYQSDRVAQFRTRLEQAETARSQLASELETVSTSNWSSPGYSAADEGSERRSDPAQRTAGAGTKPD